MPTIALQPLPVRPNLRSPGRAKTRPADACLSSGKPPPPSPALAGKQSFAHGLARAVRRVPPRACRRKRFQQRGSVASGEMKRCTVDTRGSDSLHAGGSHFTSSISLHIQVNERLFQPGNPQDPDPETELRRILSARYLWKCEMSRYGTPSKDSGSVSACPFLRNETA